MRDRNLDLILAGGVLLAMLAALYMAFIYAPPERTMGDLQRIMYFHVASAWNAYLAFFVVFILSIWYLRRPDPNLNRWAVASAEIGVLFTTITLLSGTLWARPVWNTWWVWEPRLTTTLILWFLYVGYLLIQQQAEGEERRARFAAIFGIIAFIDVPIVHFSVVWWTHLHPWVIRPTGVLMEPEMLAALLTNVVAFTLLYVFLLRRRYGLERLRDELAVVKEALRR